MSVSAIAWAITQDTTPTEKLILICMANYADEDGVAWPSIQRLMWDTGLSRRSIQRNLNNIKKKEIIEAARRGGAGCGSHTNIYALQLQKPGRTYPKKTFLEGGVTGAHCPDSNVPQWHIGGVTVTPNPSINHQDNKYINKPQSKLTEREEWIREMWGLGND